MIGYWGSSKQPDDNLINLGKLQPNLEGPYQVTSIVRTGTYRLEDQEGRPHIDTPFCKILLGTRP